jgi:hypothetical protein
MSLAIRAERIIGVYALGQWYSVLKGSFEIDAYELIDDLGGSEGDGKYQNIYQLGNTYPPFSCGKELPGPGSPGTLGEHWHFLNPDGMHGCQWIDMNGEKITMCILEVKAWAEESTPS